jgi:hypothetical protein
MENNKENNSVFDLKTIKQLELTEKPIYMIGVSTYDKKVLAYCLTRKHKEKTEVVLLNQRNDEKEFKKEVNNLAKYFEATIIEEFDNKTTWKEFPKNNYNEKYFWFMDESVRKKSLEQIIESFENGKELYQTSPLFNKLVHSIYHGMTYEQAIVECIKVIDQQQEVMKGLIEKMPISVITPKED